MTRYVLRTNISGQICHFMIPICVTLGYNLLVFVLMTKLETGPRFADICKQPRFAKPVPLSFFRMCLMVCNIYPHQFTWFLSNKLHGIFKMKLTQPLLLWKLKVKFGPLNFLLHVLRKNSELSLREWDNHITLLTSALPLKISFEYKVKVYFKCFFFLNKTKD